MNSVKDTITSNLPFSPLFLIAAGSLGPPPLSLSLSARVLSISLAVIAVGLQGFRCPLLAINIESNKVPVHPSTVTEVNSAPPRARAHMLEFTHSHVDSSQMNLTLHGIFDIHAASNSLCALEWVTQERSVSCVYLFVPVPILTCVLAGNKRATGGL